MVGLKFLLRQLPRLPNSNYPTAMSQLSSFQSSTLQLYLNFITCVMHLIVSSLNFSSGVARNGGRKGGSRGWILTLFWGIEFQIVSCTLCWKLNCVSSKN